MAELDYRAVAQAFEAERPLLESFVDFAAAELEDALAREGIYAGASGRAKEVDSFAVKAVVGDRYTDPQREITDKAGMRVVVVYLRDVASVERVVRELFVVVKKEQKKDALAYNENGYLGVHLDVRLHDEQAAIYRDFSDLRLEIQIRTIAQGAWAEVTHSQLYKPPAELPGDLKRRIYRLVSLVELFDNEVEGFRTEAEETPGFGEAFALAPLAGVLLKQFGVNQKPDRQLSLVLAATLVPLYGASSDEVLVRIEAWIASNASKLRSMFQRSNPAPLVFQPEVFLILERLEHDRARLLEVWPADLPLDWLHDLASTWGIRLLGEGETAEAEGEAG